MPTGIIGTLAEVSPDPAANNELIFVADQDCIVHSALFTLVTDANVANRLVVLIADDGATPFFNNHGGTAQAASTTTTYYVFPGAPINTAQATAKSIALPTTGLRLRKNDRLRTVTVLRQAGDDYSTMVLQVEHF